MRETDRNRFVKRIFVRWVDGVVQRLDPEDGMFFQPCIHPLGQGAVFWGGVEGYPRIWQHAFDEQKASPLTPADSSAMQPSYDLNGERIVFISDRDSDLPKMTLAERIAGWRNLNDSSQDSFNVYLMDFKSMQTRRITHGSAQDSRPAFSPDGKTIVFFSDRSGQPSRLHIVPADGSAEPRLLPGSPWAGRPWYSLDGEWIYFFTDVGEHRRICRIPAEGGQWEPVTPEGYPHSHGAFCDFDGEHLWFHSSRDGIASIYRFHLPSGHLEQVEIPGYPSAAHVTRDRSGNMTFDMRILL